VRNGYTVAIWLEPSREVWPTAKHVQLQRDFGRRVAALTWAMFARELIPWATGEFVVRGWDDDGHGELIVGGADEPQSFEDPSTPLEAERGGECVVCGRRAALRVYVAEAPPVSLCDRCGRTKSALLATVRAVQVARVSLSRAAQRQ
jgi:hypothetical protein